MRIRVWLLGALPVAACATREVEKPTPPEMTETVAAYQAPTAPFTAENATLVYTELREIADTLRQLGADGRILEALRVAIDAQQTEPPQESAAAEQVRSVQQSQLVFGDGYLRSVRTCNGWGQRAIADRAGNGYVLLTAGFDDDSVDPIVWGGFWNCRYRVGDARILLTGAEENSYGLFSAYIGENVSLDDVGRTETVFRFDLLAAIDDVELPLDFDFKVTPDTGLLETRISVSGGYVIPAIAADLVGVRATNGTFTCDTALRSCSNGVETVDF